jgi:hypothetical protein
MPVSELEPELTTEPYTAPSPVQELVRDIAENTLPFSAPAAAQATRTTVKLGDINARISPLSITADGLASLGFKPVGTDRAAKLYAESDLLSIYRALYRVIQTAAVPAQAAG